MSGPGTAPVNIKIFKPKNDLPVLDCYKSQPGVEFWQRFPAAKVEKGTSLVSAAALREVCRKWGCSDRRRLERVCGDLEEGADIGCRGICRASSFSKNAGNSYRFGQQVTDEIASWILSGFASGLVEEEDLPAEAKVNSILCREKPNGAVRVILNLSAPAGASVNDGINSEEFPAVMSSTEKWIAVLNRAGRGCRMVKIDWAAAYKHVAVRKQDINLQWFQWLGKFFVEKCLVFGGASSAGIYDRLAKTVLGRRSLTLLT